MRIALQTQEGDIKDCLDDLKKAIAGLSSSSGSRASPASSVSSGGGVQQMRLCNQLGSRARNLLESMQLELRTVKDESIRNGYENNLQEFRGELRKLQTELEFRRKEISSQRDSRKKQSLLAGGQGGFGQSAAERLSDIRIEMDTGDGQQQMQAQNRAVALGDQLQDRTEESLKRILRMANDAEVVGQKALQEMHAQENRMGRVHEDMDDVHATLARTKNVVAGLMRGAASDKCVQILCAFIVLVILLCIILAAVGADQGRMNVPDEVRSEGNG
ncbi:unnamed protein product [Amoebophrya sp. A25]|nr:unnamed protein product [Amoebophrya sp. A25]|eukprot:GSA25T00009533001.1